MNTLFALIAASALGVDIGWQPLGDGGLEYVIQIEPELLDALRRDRDITSEIPRQLDVRRFRITVGKEKLPRIRSLALPVEETAAEKNENLAGTTGDAETPSPLHDAATGSPPDAARLANHELTAQPREADKKPTLDAPPADPSAADEPEPAWFPLTVSLAALCVSLGCNAYLGWIAWGARGRYRALLEKMQAARSPA